MKKLKVIAGILIVATLIIFVSLSPKQSPKTITLGFIGPLTGDGAVFGEAIKAGIEVALDDLKKDPDFKKTEIKVIFEDGKCNGKDAASAAQKLISVDQVKYIIGGSCSGEMLSVIPIAEAAHVIAFSPSASNAKISEMGEYVFRNHPSDSFAGKELAKLMASFESVAVITGQTEYSEGIRQVFVDELKSKNKVPVFDSKTQAAQKDFRSLISQLKQLNPEAVFLNTADGPTFAIMAKQARELGITSQFYGAYFTGADVVNSGSAVEGSIFVDVAGLDAAQGKHVAESFKAKYGKDPDYAYFVGSGYDAFNLLVGGIAEVGDNTDKVRDHLYELENYRGSIGTYGFDKNGDIEGIELVVKKIENGKIVEVK